MRCLNNNKASLTWRVIRGALWVSKRFFSTCLAISPKCIWCGDMEESIALPGRCASFLKATKFAYCMESSLSWKTVLYVAMWFRHWTGWNTRYENRALDDMIEGIPRIWVFLSSNVGSLFKYWIKSKILCEIKRLFFGVRRKVGEICVPWKVLALNFY